MNDVVFFIQSEWDIGQARLVFKTRQGARKWLEQNENLNEIVREEERSIEDLWKAGLLSIDELTLLD